MRRNTLLASIAVMIALAAASLPAQQDTPTTTPSKGKMGAGMMGGMADHMAEMKGGHREIAQLVDKLAQSFAAVQAEKDPAALAAKLTEHAAVLKELQTKVQTHSEMMKKMEKEDAAPAAPAPAEHKH